MIVQRLTWGVLDWTSRSLGRQAPERQTADLWVNNRGGSQEGTEKKKK